MRRLLLAFLLLLPSALPARADAVVMKSGERHVGDVTDEGDFVRVVNASHPQGLALPKSAVDKIYPQPLKILTGARLDVDKARLLAGDVNNPAEIPANRAAALDLLHDAEVLLSQAIEVYPDSKPDFLRVLSDVVATRKFCRGETTEAPVDRVPPKEDAQPPATPPKTEDKAPPADPVLVTPKGTTAMDAAKALKVMLARLKDHGFEGVAGELVAAADPPALKFTCAAGMTPEMRARIVWYGERPGAKLELRRVVTLTETQKEQFAKPAPADAATTAAPKGTKWIPLGATDTILVADKSAAGFRDFGEPQPAGKRGVYFELSKSAAAAIRKDTGFTVKNNFCRAVAVVLDGVAFRMEGMSLQYEPDRNAKGEGDDRLRVGVVEGGSDRDSRRAVRVAGEKVWLNTGYTEKDWTPIRIAAEKPLPFGMKEGE